MNGQTLLIGFHGALAMLLCVAMFTDSRKRIIPNWLNAIVAVLGIGMWFAAGYAPWPDMAQQLGIGLAVFGLFAAMFAFGGIGGGDVKLLGALALWFPVKSMVTLLILMGLIGGLVTFFMVAFHKIGRSKEKLKIPYGLAIGLAGLWVIYERYLNQFAG